MRKLKFLLFMHVVVDVRAHAYSAAEARRVDGDEGFSVQLEFDVDAVACRAGDVRDDHAREFHQCVDERALSDVSASDDGDLHHVVKHFFRFIADPGFLREMFVDELKEFLAPAILLCADGDQIPAEGVKVVRVIFKTDVVCFIDDTQNGDAETAYFVGDVFIEGDDPLFRIHDKQNDVCHVDGGLDLMFYVVREVICINDPHSARVDEGKLERLGRIVSVDVDLCAHPVARHACRWIDDRHSSSAEPVKEARFSNVRASNDNYFGKSHDFFPLSFLILFYTASS